MVGIIKDLKEAPALPQEWQGFKPGAWTESIDVRISSSIITRPIPAMKSFFPAPPNARFVYGIS